MPASPQVATSDEPDLMNSRLENLFIVDLPEGVRYSENCSKRRMAKRI
jgi:hypothetical protein